jgi:hypothetical protein
VTLGTEMSQESLWIIFLFCQRPAATALVVSPLNSGPVYHSYIILSPEAAESRHCKHGKTTHNLQNLNIRTDGLIFYKDYSVTLFTFCAVLFSVLIP